MARMSASQAGRRGFDPRLPLFFQFHQVVLIRMFKMLLPTPQKLFNQQLSIYVGLLVLILLSGCNSYNNGSSFRQPQSAEYYYLAGQKALHANELVQAEIAFKQALRQQSHFASAFFGLARVDYLRGKLHRAEGELVNCIQTDKNQISAYFLLSKIYLDREDFKSANTILIQAEKYLPQNIPSQLQRSFSALKAEALAGTGNFKEANGYYQKAAEASPADSSIRKRLKKNVQLLQVTQGQPEILRQIARKKQITRGDLAFLFQYMLPLTDSIKKPVSGIKDLPMDPNLRMALLRSLRLSWLPVLPDGTVRPDDLLQRAELAIFLSRILKQRELAKFETAQTIEDVEDYLPYYEDVLRMSVFGIMPLDKNNFFLPDEPVSGEEALLAVDRLSRVLKRAGLPFYFKRQKSERTEKK